MDYTSLLDSLIVTLVKENASDLHLVYGAEPTIRLNGELIKVTAVGKLNEDTIVNMLKLMITDKMYERFDRDTQLDFSYSHRGEYRVRGSAYKQSGTVAVALRLILKVKNFEELSLPLKVLDMIRSVRQGFFLVTGPVGSGKSTTLAAIIADMNKNEKKNIITLEDPIEYVHEHGQSLISQREIGFDAITFSDGLLASLRQDPDVIMIGEMRDVDTISTAVTAAETSHLVLSTLHTNSASQTIDRIIDVFPGDKQNQIRFQLASCLLGILSQRLLPRVSGGMVPAYELLIVTPAVQNLIRENRAFEIDLMIDTGADIGMVSLDRSLADLVRRGEVPLDVAAKYAKNISLFERYIG